MFAVTTNFWRDVGATSLPRRARRPPLHFPLLLTRSLALGALIACSLALGIL